MPPHPLTNFQIQKHYQKEPKFNGVYSKNILPKIKYRAYIIIFDEYKSLETLGNAENLNAEMLNM